METTLDNRHTLARPYWARPGFALFAKKADDAGEGGAADDEDDDEEEDDEEDEEDADADKSEDELRAELKSVRESLSKASGSSKIKRDRIKKLRDELAEARKPKPKADEADEKVDADAIKAAAKAEARAESDSRIRKTAARAELKAAGIPADQVGRLVGLIEDLDELDVDDDGTIDGLDDAIAELKTAWPQLFNVKPIKRQRASVAGSGDDKAPKGKLSPSQIQAARATGKRAS